MTRTLDPHRAETALYVPHLLNRPLPWYTSPHFVAWELCPGDEAPEVGEVLHTLRRGAARGDRARGLVLVEPGRLEAAELARLATQSPWPVVLLGDAPGPGSYQLTVLPRSVLELPADLAGVVLSALADMPRRRGDDLEQIVRDAIHELRTPLTVVMEFAGLLEDGIGGDLTERAMGYVGQILRAAERLAGDLDDFREGFRLRQGSLPGEPETFEPESVVQRVAARSEGRLRHCANDRSLAIHADVRAFEKTLECLARGVSSLAERGRPLDVRCEAVDGDVALVVQYEGRPPAESDRRLFAECFIESEDGITTLAGVFGLAASLAARLVRRDGASLHLEETAVGGRVVVRYPAAVAPLVKEAA